MIFAQETTLVGDVNCDGEINSEDASLILQYVTNTVDSLPCESNMTGLTPDQLQEMIELINTQFNSVPSPSFISILYPQGYYGQPITQEINENSSYTVPEGQNLYITEMHSPANYIIVQINDKTIGKSYYDDGHSSSFPLILKAGDTIIASSAFSTIFNGILIDESELLSPMTQEINEDSSYTVPEGQNLYITEMHSPANYIIVQINDKTIGKSYYDDGHSSSFPLILKSGDTIIASSAFNTTFNGYLADENYFLTPPLTSSISNANENYVLLNSDQYNLSVNFDTSFGTLAIGAQITEVSILNSYLYKGLTCNVYDNNNILLNSTGVFNHPSQSTNWSLGLDLENGDIIHIHITCMSSLGMIVIDESFTVSE
tara:strand:+ start:1714 stop:2832 length:1119 start_codon:yes stop_codon:yes gene_type:complete